MSIVRNNRNSNRNNNNLNNNNNNNNKLWAAKIALDKAQRAYLEALAEESAETVDYDGYIDSLMGYEVEWISEEKTELVPDFQAGDPKFWGVFTAEYGSEYAKVRAWRTSNGYWSDNHFDVSIPKNWNGKIAVLQEYVTSFYGTYHYRVVILRAKSKSVHRYLGTDKEYICKGPGHRFFAMRYPE